MAQALNLIDVSYAGEATSWMLLRPIASADTVEKGLINIEETRKEKHYPRLEVSNFLQSDSPTPTTQGQITIDQNVIVLNTWQFFLTFDPQEFSQHWTAPELQPEILDRSLPSTIETYLIKHILEKNNQLVDQMIWKARLQYNPDAANYVTPASKGDNSPDSPMLYYFDGLITQALNDPNTIQIANPYTLSATNSVAALQLVYNAVPYQIKFKYGANGLKFIVSYNTWSYIQQQYNLTTQFKNPDFSQITPEFFLNYQVVPVSGFPDNTIIACLASPDNSKTNTFMAVNSTDDQSQIKLAPMLNYSDMWFIRAKMKMGVCWGFTDFTVIFSTITA